MATTPGLRLKTFWFKDERPRDPSQVATGTAAIVWRTANLRIQSMRKGRFRIDVGADYANVLVELLAFMVAVADRIVCLRETAPWRREFTSALTIRVGELFEDSLNDLIGPDPDPRRGWRRRFVDRANLRMGEFAMHDVGDDGPSFGFVRHFGQMLTEAMADPADRHWALDQAMTVEGPEMVDVLTQSLRGLLGLQPKPARRAHAGE